MTKMVRALTVITADRPGLLTEITELLAANEVTLSEFSADVVGKSALFKFVPVKYETAYKLLKEAGYQLIAHRNVLVRMEDRPGSLARLSSRMSEAGIEARGLHIVGHQGDFSLVAIEVSDPELAREVLADILI